MNVLDIDNNEMKEFKIFFLGRSCSILKSKKDR